MNNSLEPINIHNKVRIFQNIFVALHWVSMYKIGGEIIFRGQSNVDYDWIPSLFRKDKKYQKEEEIKTKKFINAFSKEFPKYNSLTELQLLAIAQHYGFSTKLLDFTFNPKVAAFFASPESKCKHKYGEIAFISLKEHKQMQNPFEELGLNKDDAKKIFNKNSMYVGDFKVIYVPDVPRIKRQEAVFLYDASLSILRETFLDRYGFVQITNKPFIDPDNIICQEYLFPSDDPIYNFVIKYESSKRVAHKSIAINVDQFIKTAFGKLSSKFNPNTLCATL